MKRKSIYLEVKEMLRTTANDIKRAYPNDKPMIRMGINNAFDYYSKEYDLTPYQVRLLDNYACKLHPKD